MSSCADEFVSAAEGRGRCGRRDGPARPTHVPFSSVPRVVPRCCCRVSLCGQLCVFEACVLVSALHRVPPGVSCRLRDCCASRRRWSQAAAHAGSSACRLMQQRMQAQAWRLFAACAPHSAARNRPRTLVRPRPRVSPLCIAATVAASSSAYRLKQVGAQCIAGTSCSGVPPRLARNRESVGLAMGPSPAARPASPPRLPGDRAMAQICMYQNFFAGPGGEARLEARAACSA